MTPQFGVSAEHRLTRITIGIFISLLARGVSSLHSRIFCYSAISSAAIVGILPGYLICGFWSPSILPSVAQ
jgi:hypothetical protein